jgi:hypothetical protein
VADDQFKVLTQFMILSLELEDQHEEEVENSYTYFRLRYFYLEFRWILKCISQNAYHQAIREMRFVLDSMVQAYYIDKEHLGTKRSCKLEIVRELDRFRQGQFISQTDLKKEDRSLLKVLYTELCQYVHPSFKEITDLQARSEGELRSLKFEQDPRMKELCSDLLNRTMDAVFYVALSLFPEISRPPKKFAKMGASFQRSAKALGLKLTSDKWLCES